MYKQGVPRLQVLRRHQLAGAGRDARGPRLRAQHPRRRVERRDAGEPRLLRRQRRVRHLARPRRPGAGDADRRHPGLQQRARGPGRRPPLQLRRGLPAALGRARRRGRADPGQSRTCSKIFIVTEKISVHDAREIRAMGQQNGIDIFGGNSLGVADAWNQVRIGGALGGDNPGEALLQGLDRDLLQLRQLHHHHRATTCAWPAGARRRSISSGKDVYIHFAAPEFAFALANDARSKAAVLYCRAGRLLRARRELHQAGRRLRGRALEGQADPRGRPCRRDGRRRRRRRRPRNAGSWRSSASTASSRPTTRSSRPRARWSPTSPTSRRR